MKRFIGLTLLTFACCSFAKSDKQLVSKQTELKQITQNIQAVQKSIVKNTERKSQLQNDLQGSQQKINHVQRKISGTAQELSAKRQKLAGLVRQQKEIESQLALQQQRLASQISAFYRVGHLNSLKIILNNDDPARISRHLMYYGYVHRERTQLIQDIGSNLSVLAENRRLYQEAALQLSSLLHRQKQEEQELEQQREQHRVIISQIGEQLKSQQQRLSELQANKQQLEQLITRLSRIAISSKRTYSFTGKFANQRGKLRWPVQGKVSHRFGIGVANNAIIPNGVFITAAAGSDVRAVFSGQVIFADFLKGFGMLIILDHGNGFMSLYAHNQSLKHKVGESVKSGDVIADIGHSGGITENGVYFEIRHNGKPINPQQWCG